MRKNKMLSSIILVSFLVSIIAVSPVNASPTGLVGEWNLDEGTGSIAADSINGNDGILSGGKFGNALFFDGDGDYVDIPDDDSLDVIGDLTVEAWIKIEAFDTDEGMHMYVVGKDLSGERSYGIGVDLTWGYPKRPFVIIFHPGGSYKVGWGSTDLMANQWYHLAGVFDSAADTVTLYVNGFAQPSVTDTSTVNPGDANLRIGGREYVGARCTFNGIIDEVRISDVVRYSGVSFSLQTSEFSPDGNTVGLWHFDESVGTIASDSSGNNNHGTIVNAKWAGPTWATGTWGDGLQFDGINDNVRVEDDDSLDLSEGVTIEATIYPERISGYQTVVSKRQGQANYALRLWGSRINFYCTDSTTGWDEWYTENIVTANNWYSIVATYDFANENSMKIVVNDVEQTLTLNHVYDSGVIENNYPVYMGIIGGGSQQFKGIMDEIKIWNYALEGLTLVFDDVYSDAVAPIGSVADLRVCLKDFLGNEVSGMPVNIEVDKGLGLDLPNPTITDTDGCVTFKTATISTADVYTITATVTTPIGVIDATWKLAVYDPSAGFVTGGGWIMSPAGAYTDNPELTGKASFGFVSKYKKGANVPTGNTAFVFDAGSLEFHSTSYQWLVITGSDKAIFKGEGSVNDVAGYGFMLSATDGGKGGVDSFRIKIWEIASEEVIYDNIEETTLGGGSIIVHTK